MSFTHGMNIADVDALGQLLKRNGLRLDGMIGEIDRLVYSTGWGGDSGHDFLRRWPVYKGKLLAASERLTGLGQAALNNVGEQLDASRGMAAAPSLRRGGGAGGAEGWRVRLPGLSDLANLGLRELGAGVAGFLPEAVRKGGRAWKSGFGFLGRNGVHASFASGVVGRLNLASGVAIAAIDGYGSWVVQGIRDSGDATLDGVEAGARQAGAGLTAAGLGLGITVGAGMAGGAAATAVAGAAATAAASGAGVGDAIGTLIPIPGVGTVVGAAVGIGVAVGVNAALDIEIGSMTAREHLVELGADTFDAGVDGFRWLGDRAGDAVGEIAEVADRYWPW